MTDTRKQNYINLAVFSTILVTIGIVQGMVYPYPFLFPDTGAYVLGGLSGQYNGYRPMGYSAYLSCLHSLYPSLQFIYAVTYFLYAASTLCLLFSARRILQIRSNTLFIAVGILSIISPRIIYSCNFLMSDALFLILVNVLITLILWTVEKKSWLTAIFQLPVLWCTCNVRYSGLFMIPVCVVSDIIALPGKRKLWKAAVCILPVLLGLVFYSHVSQEAEENTGVKCFSAFGGWQLINNASVLMPEARKLEISSFDDDEMKALHAFLCGFPEETFNNEYTLSTSYMWDNNLPYKQFLYSCLNANENSGYQNCWVLCGQLYGKYARKLILKFPFKYISRFVIPSFVSYFKFNPIEGHGLAFKNEDIYRIYYNVYDDFEYPDFDIYACTNPVRKVTDILYWILSVACTVFFFACFSRQKDRTPKMAALFIILFILIFIMMQTMSSPNTTWRYTMPFYIPSLMFIMYCIDMFIRRLSSRATQA